MTPSRPGSERAPADSLSFADPLLQRWFRQRLGAPTRAQTLAWPSITQGESALLLAPTGSGKTLAAFLVALNRLLFVRDSDAKGAKSQRKTKSSKRQAAPARGLGPKVLYLSPLKALGVDVERNLRQPLSELSALAQEEGRLLAPVKIGVRSGDTKPSERAKLLRSPPDLLITTPESLYLMLTSRARETLRLVETVIVDEIHALSGTKRGSHLAMSLERLEALKSTGPRLQRIGLSATQRPLDEIAALLGGSEWHQDTLEARPVTVLDAGEGKRLELSVEVPVEDMTAPEEPPSQEQRAANPKGSMWPSIHQRILDLVRGHRSTLVFVNNRALAERLAGALNELAGQEVALPHHGSLAQGRRGDVEQRLKTGQIPAVVATGSLELGIDMGAIELVIQVESPLGVAAGLQRIGRAGHQVDATSRGVLLPKFRSDLLASAAFVELAKEGRVEATQPPKNPLDVLAQHVVAMVSVESINVESLYRLVRQAKPFNQLPRELFENVLDLLSGRFPSHRFRELKPRLSYNRSDGSLEPRKGAGLLALTNPGTIPDRGLYAVYMSGTDPVRRVGELDEELVFEMKPGEVLTLGASSWRLDEITYDRVLVSPAPGEPGRTPFWHGGKLGRSLEFGKAIGKLSREVADARPEQADQRLAALNGLDRYASKNLIAYLQDQRQAGALPTDQQLVIEFFRDPSGDFRAVLLCPFGSRLLAPWAMLVQSQLQSRLGRDVDAIWTDDGIVFRLPDLEQEAHRSWFIPKSDDLFRQLSDCLGGTALFAARFRENAARSLLLPRRRPQGRQPLWLQRRRAADLLKVASEFEHFPITLETQRQLLQDDMDVTGLNQTLQAIEQGDMRVVVSRNDRASPFASAVLFSFLGEVIYDLDAPLAERRARALSLDTDQLQLLLGKPALRELIDPQVLELVISRRQRLDGPALQEAEEVTDRLQQLGALTTSELRTQAAEGSLEEWLQRLEERSQICRIQHNGHEKWISTSDAARYRDGLGVEIPESLPQSLLEPADNALEELVFRWSCTIGPFTTAQACNTFGNSGTPAALESLAAQGRLLEGEFRPGASGSEWCERDTLDELRRRSLAAYRERSQAVSQRQYISFLQSWQGLSRPALAEEELLETIAQLQGLSLNYSVWVQEVLPLRIQEFRPTDLDALCSLGKVIWRAMGKAKPDVKVALFLCEDYVNLAPPAESVDTPLTARIVSLLTETGALFFSDIQDALGGFEPELADALWTLVSAGIVSNDTLLPVRSLAHRSDRRPSPRRIRRLSGSRSGRPGTEGRWSLLPTPGGSVEERQRSLVEQWLDRYGVVTKESILSEKLPGGLSVILPALTAMEDAALLRRGYFIDGLSGMQFGTTAALTLLRKPHRSEGFLFLSSQDPANPYGTLLPWPEHPSARAARLAGNTLVFHGGQLCALFNDERVELYPWTPLQNSSQTRERDVQDFSEALVDWLRSRRRWVWIVETINGQAAAEAVHLSRSVDASEGVRDASSLARALCKLGARIAGSRLHWNVERSQD